MMPTELRTPRATTRKSCPFGSSVAIVESSGKAVPPAPWLAQSSTPPLEPAVHGTLHGAPMATARALLTGSAVR